MKLPFHAHFDIQYFGHTDSLRDRRLTACCAFVCSLSFVFPPCRSLLRMAPTTANLMKRAQAAYEAKHFSESVSLYLQALPLVQDNDRAGGRAARVCTKHDSFADGASLSVLESGPMFRRICRARTSLLAVIPFLQQLSIHFNQNLSGFLNALSAVRTR
jgi:hypothetical protein